MGFSNNTNKHGGTKQARLLAAMYLYLQRKLHLAEVQLSSRCALQAYCSGCKHDNRARVVYRQAVTTLWGPQVGKAFAYNLLCDRAAQGAPRSSGTQLLPTATVRGELRRHYPMRQAWQALGPKSMYHLNPADFRGFNVYRHVKARSAETPGPERGWRSGPRYKRAAPEIVGLDDYKRV